MICGNERLIVVLGMAHSGTTILSYVLRQHPEVVCCTDGTEAWILENSWLPLEQAEPIERLLTRFATRRVLLKRPWNEVWHGDWMKREMPNASFIYCYRSFADTAASWCKPTSFVEDQLRFGGVEYQRNFYEMCWQRAQSFGSGVPCFRKHYHADFVADPAKVIAVAAAWLGLAPFKFNVGEVSSDKDIKSLLWARRVRRA